MLIILEKIGWGMLALTGFIGGIIGLALPVIPQVPFFLLALFALSKLSPRFHRWLTSPLVSAHGRSSIGKVPCQAPNQKARTDQSGTRLSKLIKQKGF